MASKASVINAALHHLGEPESANPLTDASEWVARIRSRYDGKVRLLFEKHPWNFCSVVEQLSATEPEPAGWTYGFNKPAKCWRILKVTDALDNMRPDMIGILYEDQAGRILSDQETTFLKYISGDWLTLEGSWPQVFADAVSAELAHAVVPVTDSNEQTEDKLERKAGKFFRIAKNWDAQQNLIWTQPPSKWQVNRFSGMSPRSGENG